MSAGAILNGREIQGDLQLSCDVVVVGSGAGGAVVACTLAQAGHDVIVLEEGGHTPPSVYSKYRPTEALRRMGREGGTTAAVGLGDTPVISLLAGRGVGGSSVLTGGVCFRIPEIISHHWVDKLGLQEMSGERLLPAYQSVEERLHIGEVPKEMRSRSTNLFAEGAQRMGVTLKSLRRNTHACRGAGLCNFGCPYLAKMSVDLTFLPDAVASGARIYADVLVDRVLTKDGRAAGVEGRFLTQDAQKRGKITVHAKTVVVACGTLHTPQVLKRSGVARKASQGLGRHITLHPGFRVAALFDEEIQGWKGSMQAAYSDHYEEEGITLVGIFPPANVLAAAMPGVGPEYMERVARMGRLATFGGMIHDDGGGRLWNVPGREPLLTYRMAQRDKERMHRGIGILASAFFAAGAKEIYLPIYGAKPIRKESELKLLDQHIPGALFESVAFHPLGSARMGVDANTSVVKQSGESHDLPGLYVADGSVLPTSIGVNSQLPIMTIATHIAWGLREKLGAKAAA